MNIFINMLIRCTKCKNKKDEECFRKRKGTYTGYQYWCIDCENEGGRKRYIPKEKKSKILSNKSIEEIQLDQKRRNLKHKYGITYEEYLDMYNQQNKKCKICQKERTLGGRKGLYVDHCHTTKKVRGLLCPTCNTVIGKLQDDPNYVKSILIYFNEHSVPMSKSRVH
jgi:hypothetical protein